MSQISDATLERFIRETLLSERPDEAIDSRLRALEADIASRAEAAADRILSRDTAANEPEAAFKARRQTAINQFRMAMSIPYQPLPSTGEGDLGVGAAVGRSLARGGFGAADAMIGGAFNAIGGATEVAGRKLGLPALELMGQDTRWLWEQARNRIGLQHIQEGFAPSRSVSAQGALPDFDSFGQAGRFLLERVPEVAAQLGLTVGAGGTARALGASGKAAFVGTATAQEFDEVFRSTYEQTGNVEEAFIEAAVYGVASAALEKIPADQFFRGNGARVAALRRIIGGAVAEGGTEAAQSATQALVNQIGQSDPEAIDNLLENALGEGLLGAIAGGGVAGAQAATSRGQGTTAQAPAPTRSVTPEASPPTVPQTQPPIQPDPATESPAEASEGGEAAVSPPEPEAAQEAPAAVVERARRNEFSRAAMEREILASEWVRATLDAEGDTTEADRLTGDQVSFAFTGPLPGEIRTAIEGRPELRRFFTANDPNGRGEYTLSEIGADEMVRIAESFINRTRRSMEATLDAADVDPRSAYLANVIETAPQGRVSYDAVVDAGSLPAETTFTVNGQAGRIAESGDGSLLAMVFGREFDAAGLGRIPVDEGSLSIHASIEEAFERRQIAEDEDAEALSRLMEFAHPADRAPDPLSVDIAPNAPELGLPVARGSSSQLRDIPTSLDRAPGAEPSADTGPRQVIRELAGLAEDLGRDVPVRIGRNGRRNLGVYKSGPHVIRIQNAADIPTAAHEVAHAFDTIVFGAGAPSLPSGAPTELRRLGRALYGSTRPAGGYMREGFAEFVRLYLSDPGKAAKTAPKFNAHFESVMSGLPTANRRIGTIRQQIKQYGQQGAEARVAQQVARRSPARETATRVREQVTKDKWIDQAAPLERLAEEAERLIGRPLAQAENPYDTATGLAMTHTARVRYMADHAMIDLAGNPVGPSLREALAPVRGQKDAFTLYLLARRTIALATPTPEHPQGRATGIDVDDARFIVNKLGSPEFQLAASGYYQWWDGVLNYLAQTGPTMRAVVDQIRAGDAGDYVPLHRVFDDLADSWRKPSSQMRRQVMGDGPFDRLKGSGRRIKDPLPTTLSQAEKLVRAAHERVVIEQVVRLSKIPGMGQVIEEVPREMAPLGLDAEQLAEELQRQLGASVSGTAAGDIVTIFLPAQHPKGQDPIIPINDNGKIRWFYVREDLYQSLQGLDVYRLPKALDLTLGVMTRTFRLGTTGFRASFTLLTNPQRDFQTFVMQSRSGNPAEMLGAYFEGVEEAVAGTLSGRSASGLWDAFVRLGGRMAQPLGPDTSPTQRAARELTQGKVRFIDPRNWYEYLRDALQVSEAAPRIAEMRIAARDAGWKPGTPMTFGQSIEILNAAKRVTVDFTRAGQYGRMVNQAVPFFNASVQGTRTAYDTVTRRPVRSALYGLTALTIPTLLLWDRHKDEEWYQNIPLGEKYKFWYIAVGDRDIVRIPRAFEWGTMFAAIPEALMDAWYAKDPEAAKQAVKELKSFVPPLMPQAARVPFEQLANRNFYFDRPILPRGDEYRPPNEQAGPYTSRLAKFMGDTFADTALEDTWLGSPRRVDHLISGTFGPLGLDVVRGVEKAIGVSSSPDGQREFESSDTVLFGRMFRRGGRDSISSRPVREVYDLLEKAERRQGSAENPETPEERTRRLLLEDATKAMGALRNVSYGLRRTEDRDRVHREINRIAREAVRAARGDVGPRDRAPFTREKKIAERREARAEQGGN